MIFFPVLPKIGGTDSIGHRITPLLPAGKIPYRLAQHNAPVGIQVGGMICRGEFYIPGIRARNRQDRPQGRSSLKRQRHKGDTDSCHHDNCTPEYHSVLSSCEGADTLSFLDKDISASLVQGGPQTGLHAGNTMLFIIRHPEPIKRIFTLPALLSSRPGFSVPER